MVWFVLLLGLPGSGKGTQLAPLCEALKQAGKKVRTVEVGKSLRKIVFTSSLKNHLSKVKFLRKSVLAKSNPFTTSLLEKIQKGGLVPESLPIAMLANTLCRGSYSAIVTDGIGRRESEVKSVLELFRIIPNSRIDTIFLDAPLEEVEARLLQRKRGEDDSPEAIEKRIQEYLSETSMAIEFLRADGGVGFHTIDGTGAATEVHQRITNRLGIPPFLQ